MKGARSILFLLVFLFILTPTYPFIGSPSLSQTIDDPTSAGTHFTESFPHSTASSSQAPLANGNAPRNWTVLVYMAADNEQEIAAYENIKEMEVVGSTQQVNILIYVDFLTNTTNFGPGAYTYNITKDDHPTNNTIVSEPLNSSLPTEPNMGDPATLLSFIQFGQNYSQAEHYMLIFWDKGTGYTGVCYDETSGGDRLLPQEIALVLNNDTLDPIDITAFDASLMGQLELAYEIHEGTDYIIFSESEIPYQHFPYHIILNSLVMYEDSTPFLLAKEVVDRYISAYSIGGTYYLNYLVPPTNLCLSVINSSHIPEVFMWFDQTINWLNTSYNTYNAYSEISTARGLTQQFKIANYIDLGTFIYYLEQGLPNPTFKNYAGNLSLSISAAVIYHLIQPGVARATGIGINFDYYESVSLSLLSLTAYEDFLTKFFAIGETVSTSILNLHMEPITGYLDGESDSVFYRFTPTIAAEHSITLTDYQTVDEDFDLYLYDVNLNLLTRSVGLSSDEAVQWALVPGQLYYLQVFSNPRPDITYGLGSFEIIITPGSPVNPVTFVIQMGITIAVACIIIFIGYLIWLYREQIKGAIEQYRLRRMARRIQRETSEEAAASTTAASCEKCGEELPEGAKFCPECGKTFTEAPKESKD
jgi:hypothetical protein